MPDKLTELFPYFLFTRTPLHVGAGQSVGYVDLPIQREAHTRIPIVPGSSLKGVLRDHPLFADEDEKAFLFGKEAGGEEGAGQAGSLLIGEARVLAFPIRSAKGAFAWITCPLVLARYMRDSIPDKALSLPSSEKLREADDGSVHVLAGEKVAQNGRLVLEEYTFAVEDEDLRGGWERHLLQLLPDEPVWRLLEGRLVILPDGIFSFFVQSACEVAQHVSISDETGTAKEGALFNQENCPSEVLFYGVIAAQAIRDWRPAQSLSLLKKLSGSTIQIGGGETTGLGWCTFTFDFPEEEGH